MVTTRSRNNALSTTRDRTPSPGNAISRGKSSEPKYKSLAKSKSPEEGRRKRPNEVSNSNNKEISSNKSLLMHSTMTPMEIEERKKIMREDRRKITLFRRPLVTLNLFAHTFARFLKKISIYVATHKITLFVGVPLVVLFTILSNVAGPHDYYLQEIVACFEFVTWWVGLGILSSVGLGTGMHSGILFLFPHIFLVVQGAERCGNVTFDTRGHIWFREFDATCVGELPEVDEVFVVPFSDIFWKVFWPCFLWGSGTAIGEIPPYAISRAAKLAGEQDEEFEDIQLAKTKFDILNRSKDWMISFLKTRGFWGVLLMSAWPNMAFDLCGICCGHFLMPFWTFFSAALVGKALIKVNLQAAFFLTMFSDDHLRSFATAVDSLAPETWNLDDKLNAFLMDCRRKFHAAHQNAKDEHVDDIGGSVFSQIGSAIMIGLIGWFALSCVEQFAQQEQARRDAEELEKLEEKKSEKRKST